MNAKKQIKKGARKLCAPVIEIDGRRVVLPALPLVADGAPFIAPPDADTNTPAMLVALRDKDCNEQHQLEHGNWVELWLKDWKKEMEAVLASVPLPQDNAGEGDIVAFADAVWQLDAEKCFDIDQSVQRTDVYYFPSDTFADAHLTHTEWRFPLKPRETENKLGVDDEEESEQ